MSLILSYLINQQNSNNDLIIVPYKQVCVLR